MHTVANLQRYWSQRGSPDDAAVRHRLVDFAFYKMEPRKLSMVLEALERRSGHKVRSCRSCYRSTRHAPDNPQRRPTGSDWQAALGQDWAEFHGRISMCRGTSPNRLLRACQHGLPGQAKTICREPCPAKSILRWVQVWNADEIRKRTEVLGADLCDEWPRPVTDTAYVSGAEEEPGKSGDSPAKRRNLEDWRRFLKRWGTRPALRFPHACDTSELVIPLNEKGDITANLWQSRRDRKQVAYVRFQGKAATKLYSQLQQKAREIDDLIEGDLRWDWPVRASFAVCEDDVDFSDRNDWELQHEWFCEELEDIVAAVTPEILAMERVDDDGDGNGSGTEREELRLQFWTEFLDYARKHDRPPRQPPPGWLQLDRWRHWPVRV